MSTKCKNFGGFIVMLGVALLLGMSLPSPATAQSSMSQAERGEKLFRMRDCEGCHRVGGGRMAGPDLQGVTQRRQTEWIRDFLLETERMLATDPLAQQLLQQFNGFRMPQVQLREDEVDAIIAYLERES